MAKVDVTNVSHAGSVANIKLVLAIVLVVMLALTILNLHLKKERREIIDTIYATGGTTIARTEELWVVLNSLGKDIHPLTTNSHRYILNGRMSEFLVMGGVLSDEQKERVCGVVLEPDTYQRLVETVSQATDRWDVVGIAALLYACDE